MPLFDCPKCAGPMLEKKTYYADPDELKKETSLMVMCFKNTWEECTKCGYKSEPERASGMQSKEFLRKAQVIRRGEPGFIEH